MACYRVRIPDAVKMPGMTAAGCPSAVLSGESLVHRLTPKGAPGAGPVLRFVGAGALGRDVHVPLAQAQCFFSQAGRSAALRAPESALDHVR